MKTKILKRLLPILGLTIATPLVITSVVSCSSPTNEVESEAPTQEQPTFNYVDKYAINDMGDTKFIGYISMDVDCPSQSGNEYKVNTHVSYDANYQYKQYGNTTWHYTDPIACTDWSCSFYKDDPDFHLKYPLLTACGNTNKTISYGISKEQYSDFLNWFAKCILYQNYLWNKDDQDRCGLYFDNEYFYLFNKLENTFETKNTIACTYYYNKYKIDNCSWAYDKQWDQRSFI